MIELKTKTTYSDFWGCDLITTYAADAETGTRYYIRCNDGVEFGEAVDLPNDIRLQKGLPEYTYTPTDIPIEEVTE